MGLHAMGFRILWKLVLRWMLIGDVASEESPLERAHTYTCVRRISHWCCSPESRISVALITRFQLHASNIVLSGAMYSHPIVKEGLDSHCDMVLC